MKQVSTSLEIETHGRGLTEFTRAVQDFVRTAGIRDGLLTAFCRHTSASLLIQENADPDVRHDLDAFFSQLSPDGQSGWHHNSERPRCTRSNRCCLPSRNWKE